MRPTVGHEERTNGLDLRRIDIEDRHGRDTAEAGQSALLLYERADAEQAQKARR
jgi:hypothetical protein